MATTATIIKTIWPDALSLSHAVANLIVTESNKAVQKKGYFTIALSGGSTPKLLFELLAQLLIKIIFPGRKQLLLLVMNVLLRQQAMRVIIKWPMMHY
jgi:hypothetical protein